MSFAKSRITESLYIGTALRLVWQSGPALAVASLTMLILQGVLALFALYLTKLMIDTLTSGLDNHQKFHRNHCCSAFQRWLH
jgi:ATP-binding cassette subfamily B protein